MTSIATSLKGDLEAHGECVILANANTGWFAVFPSTWEKRKHVAEEEGRPGPNLIIYRTVSEDSRDHHVVPYSVAQKLLVDETLTTSQVDDTRRWNLTLKNDRLHVSHRPGSIDVSRYRGIRLLVEVEALAETELSSPLVIGKRYERPQLADLWGYGGHQALSRGVFTPRGKKEIILFVTKMKQASMRQYTDYLSADTLYWEGEDGHGNDHRIAGASEGGEQIHLFYRLIHHSPFEYMGQIGLVSFEEHVDKPSEFAFRLLHDLSPDSDLKRAAHELKRVTATERQTLVRARRGQGRFREDLIALWGGCAVTGLKVSEVLRASHIKPWRHSDNRERLDPYNGLLLLPQYDSLFDRGLVGFEDDGTIILSRVIRDQDADLLGISLTASLRFIENGHRPYLAYHRDEVVVE